MPLSTSDEGEYTVATLESLSDKLWRGETTTRDPEHHPFAALNQIEEVADGVAFYKAFSNITVIRTDDVSVLIDTGSFHPVAHARSFKAIRSWTDARIDTAVYTHGHVDHAYGLPPFLQEAEDNKWGAPSILAHSSVPARMDRYIETAGYNEVINERQFGVPIEWPTDPIYPTDTYADSLELDVAGTALQLRHGKGETDDHTWVFLPKSKVLCTGDLFIWAAPNAGNPQKVQRYVIEWSRALREMARLKPAVLLPGHGLPVYGEDRVAQALRDTAEYLESIYKQTIDFMNHGATVYDLIHTVKPPRHLAEKPYLQPIYDEPEFIVRTVHRCVGGWYSGIPSELKPAPRASQAQEIVLLAGGIEKLLERARRLLKDDRLRLASHLADWAAEAEPGSTEVHQLRAQVYEARTIAEASTMSKGIFGAAQRESEAKIEADEDKPG